MNPYSEGPEHLSDGKSWGLEPKEKVIAGTQHYLSSDSSLLLGLPYGFELNSSYSFYRSDASSRTATIYIGAGKNWDQETLGFTYSITPLANNYRAHSYDVTGSFNTRSKDFTTTMTLDFNVTYHTQMSQALQLIKGVKTSVNSATDIRQITPTFTLAQRIGSTKLTLDYGKSTYDKEIKRLANRINPNSIRFQGLAGLLQGFPDMEWKTGLYQGLNVLPVTLWATYDHIKLLMAAQSQGGASDSYMVGADTDIGSDVTATLQYNYLTQTGQRSNDYYGAALSLKL